MRTRQLGQTGLEVSELGFGGIPILRLDAKHAERILHMAYDLGITLYDTAQMYGDSEQKMGAALSGKRDKLVLATKTMLRDGPGALGHLESSLQQLRTDCIDIYQLHQVSTQSEWEELSAPSGALEALHKARDKGKFRFLGVSSHSLEMASFLVRTGLFATVQFPFNIIEHEASNSLFPEARKAGMGILAMKPFAGGVLTDTRLVFAFLRQETDIFPIPGFESEQGVQAVADLFAERLELSTQEFRQMEDLRAELGNRFCRRCEYCLPCPNEVAIPTAMSYPVVVSRMSAQTAVSFVRESMDSVEQCTQCRECEEKCPYDLPITDILQENYAQYIRDCQSMH